MYARASQPTQPVRNRGRSSGNRSRTPSPMANASSTGTPIGPIGVPVPLAFAIGLGVLLRLPLDRPRLRTGWVGWLALAYIAITAVSVTPLFNGLPYGRAVSGISLF